MTVVLTCHCVSQENCAACSQVPQVLRFSEDTLLQDVVQHLKENAAL